MTVLREQVSNLLGGHELQNIDVLCDVLERRVPIAVVINKAELLGLVGVDFAGIRHGDGLVGVQHFLVPFAFVGCYVLTTMLQDSLHFHLTTMSVERTLVVRSADFQSGLRILL